MSSSCFSHDLDEVTFMLAKALLCGYMRTFVFLECLFIVSANSPSFWQRPITLTLLTQLTNVIGLVNIKKDGCQSIASVV